MRNRRRWNLTDSRHALGRFCWRRSLVIPRPGTSPFSSSERSALIRRSVARGPSTPPSQAAIKASRQCPTIRKGSSYTGMTAPSALIITNPSLTLYASPSCFRQSLRERFSGTPSTSIDTGDVRFLLGLLQARLDRRRSGCLCRRRPCRVPDVLQHVLEGRLVGEPHRDRPLQLLEDTLFRRVDPVRRDREASDDRGRRGTQGVQEVVGGDGGP